MDDVTVGGGERAPESNDDGSRRVGRIAVAIGVVVIVALVIWWLWPRFGVVPSVVGMDETAARAAIEKAGYQVGVIATRTIDTTESGRVLTQVPPAGLRVAIGQEVDFTIAEPSGAVVGGVAGGPPVTEPSGPKNGLLVPAVTGLVLSDAQNRLQVAGLPWSTEYTSSGMAAGQVIHQSPAAGVEVAATTVVKLTISTGTPSRGTAAVGYSGPTIPDVLGVSAGTARSRLAAAGYGMRTVYAPSTTTPRGLVFWQSAGPGPDSVSPATVEVWVSTGVPGTGLPYSRPPDQAPLKSK